MSCPDEAASRTWAADVASNAGLPDGISRLVATFPQDAHPMSVLLAAWSALGAYRPEARAVDDPIARLAELPRFVGSIGVPRRARLSPPDRSAAVARGANRRLRYLPVATALFPEREVEPTLVRALDILLILQADHEQNCSTNAVRAVGSSRVDPYSATAAGIAALYGPLHGGANEAVIRMLHDVGDVARVPAYIEGVKRGERRLMGFGHRVYKSYDPRAKNHQGNGAARVRSHGC